MNLEIERKFLVNADKLPEVLPDFRMIESGYFSDPRADVAIRVTISSAGRQKVCFKGPGGISREEFEYDIPLEDAHRLLALAPYKSLKMRYELMHSHFTNWTWELDFFPLLNFWIVEIEVPDETVDLGVLPEWVGQEVTGDYRYNNNFLAFKG